MSDTPTATLTATPAELPLPGGQTGASIVLHPLLCAEMKGPVGWFHRASGPTATLKALGIGVPAEQQVSVPIIAFLLEHPTAGLILIDTGFHGSVADRASPERSRNLGPIGRVLARDVQMRPEQTVAAQLRAREIDPAEVSVIVMTHLHFDHASALADFPAATVLVSEPEWQSARGRGGALRGYSVAQLDPRPSYRTLDFSAANARARGAFAQTLDVLGDDSITLAFTPGHSRGHLSVILRLSSREALIAGDAIYTMATLRDGERPWRSDDAKAFERSLSALQAYDREQPEALIIPGHDMEHWRSLDERYS
ncbi:MAG TPA: N-acyl homoserine lactonase family protein [Solirubrobacteraceae bacterium]|nr:N-acyl homoserine lactonase family protein [Solirubrobacteraceae bacterium]